MTDEEYLLASIADNFHSGTVPEKSPYNYKCNAHDLFQYDMTANSIIPTSADVTSVPEPTIPSSLKGETILLLTSGLTVNELAAAARESAGLTLRERIAAVLGGLIGYSVGKWVMARKRPACDSPKIIRRLLSTGYGVGVGRQLVKNALTEDLVIVNGEALTQISQLQALRTMLDAHPDSTDHERISHDVDALRALIQKSQQKDYKANEFDLFSAQYRTGEISNYLRFHWAAIPGLQGVTTRKALLWRVDKGFSISWRDIWSSTADFAIFVFWVLGAIVVLIILGIGITFIYVTVRHVLTKKNPDWQTP